MCCARVKRHYFMQDCVTTYSPSCEFVIPPYSMPPVHSDILIISNVIQISSVNSCGTALQHFTASPNHRNNSQQFFIFTPSLSWPACQTGQFTPYMNFFCEWHLGVTSRCCSLMTYRSMDLEYMLIRKKITCNKHMLANQHCDGFSLILIHQSAVQYHDHLGTCIWYALHYAHESQHIC